MWNTVRQLEFTLGETRQVIATRIAPNQLRRAKNCVVTADGVIETRYGKTKINATSMGTGPVLSVHMYPQIDGDDYA